MIVRYPHEWTDKPSRYKRNAFSMRCKWCDYETPDDPSVPPQTECLARRKWV